MARQVLWFIPNLISTDLTKNYSKFQDYLVENYHYEKVIVTNQILDSVDKNLKIEKISFIKTRYGYFYNFLKIIKYLKKDNIFLIYDNSYWMLFFMVIVKFFINVKAILKLDSSLENSNLNDKKAFLFRKIDLIIYESKKSKQKLINKNINNIHLLYNGLTSNDIEYLKRPIKKENIILFAGRISSEKQVNLLIDAFSELNNGNYMLKICGPLKEIGMKELTKYQLEFNQKIIKFNNVEYLGALFGEKYLNIFHKSKILVLPSKSEGLPNVLSYGLFAKCLIISTNVGSISEYLNNQNSILINETSKDFIKVALDDAINNIDTKEAQNKINNGYEFALNNLEYEKQFRGIATKVLWKND